MYVQACHCGCMKAGDKLFLSSQHVGTQDGPQVIRLGAVFTLWASDHPGALSLYQLVTADTDNIIPSFIEARHVARHMVTSYSEQSRVHTLHVLCILCILYMCSVCSDCTRFTGKKAETQRTARSLANNKLELVSRRRAQLRTRAVSSHNTSGGKNINHTAKH